MEFCPKCGAVLVEKRKNYGCPRCTYSAKGKTKICTSEKINEKREVAVISDKAVEVNPIVEKPCKKCKNKHSYFWTMQTRSSDEAETKFFKCTKCEFMWREYR
ncbi:MAG: transcription factor S [Nanoarchaeota archaeon]|nr:transcription factor S [Nanoarchaeota archaeon]